MVGKGGGEEVGKIGLDILACVFFPAYGCGVEGFLFFFYFAVVDVLGVWSRVQ